MNFKSIRNKVSASLSSAKESVSDFDFKAAGRASFNTAKVIPGILQTHAKAAGQHYQDLKAHNASKPTVITVKVERMS